MTDISVVILTKERKVSHQAVLGAGEGFKHTTDVALMYCVGILRRFLQR